MYEKFFQLQEKPFSLTPDTQFYFNKQSHRSALNTLLVALRHCEGFIKIVGEVGTGKTLLCRKLLNTLDANYYTAYIPNPYLTPDELKVFLAEEIGAPVTAGMPSHHLLGEINKRLVQLAQQKRQVVLVIDEAQAMPRETIESLRLLTNLETEKRKLLQVVLLGQPELDVMLSRPDLRQLKQRIVFSERLYPFDWKGVNTYIDFRLASAGSNDPTLFSGYAKALLFFATGGIPRLINILAHKAMIAAYGRGDKKIKGVHMAKAIADTAESRWLGRLLSWRWHWLWPAMGLASAILWFAPVNDWIQVLR